VLKTILDGLLNRGFDIDLVTSRGGVLDEISSPKLHRRLTYRYRFSSNPFLTVIRYSAVQFYTFLASFKYLFSKDTTFYINTILPVGPAMAGKLMRKKVVYHYHENAFIKGPFYRTLAKMMQCIADEIICVSDYQASFLKRKRNVTVIPNALPKEFVSQLKPNPDEAFKRKTVLMLSSLKEYKGTGKFIQLAADMPQFHFVLVINDTEENIDKYLKGKHSLLNLTIIPRTDKVADLYNSASLLLNLSNPDEFIETFGLTALESMSNALPVIVPPVGGIADMVTDGGNGYKIDCRDTERLIRTISDILDNDTEYNRLAHNAFTYSKLFNQEKMIDSLISLFSKC
jgi:glycosyltransferase involved in cell wall biosynthesis